MIKKMLMRVSLLVFYSNLYCADSNMSLCVNLEDTQLETLETDVVSLNLDILVIILSHANNLKELNELLEKITEISHYVNNELKKKGYARHIINLYLQNKLKENYNESYLKKKYYSALKTLAVESKYKNVLNLLDSAKPKAAINNEKYRISNCRVVFKIFEPDINEIVTISLLPIEIEESYLGLLIRIGGDINTKDSKGQSILIKAIEESDDDINLETISYLINAGADPNIIDDLGWTPFSRALRFGTELVKLFIDPGCDLNFQDSRGDSVLLKALYYFEYPRGVELVQLLINAGADINIKNKYGDNALSCAIRKKNISLFKLLINAGADVNIKVGYSEDTLVFLTVEENMPDFLKLLIDANADLNVIGSFDLTPLMRAIRSLNFDIAELLINAGADLSIKNKYGEDALKIAKSTGCAEYIVKLIESKTSSCVIS